MLYAKLLHLKSEIKVLQDLGLVDPVWLRNIKVFEDFQIERAAGACVYCAHLSAGIKNGISASSVKQIVKKLSGPTKEI